MEEPVATYQAQPVGGNKNKYLLIAIVIIVLLVAGFFLLRRSQNTEETTPNVTPTITPTPTEAPVVDKESVRIQVLNGTGTPGQAGIAVDLLEDAGYNPDNIEADNADEFEHTTTIIQAKEGFESVAKNIEEVLKESFNEISVDSTPLDEGSDFDIVITTGGEIFEEPTATPGPTSEVTATPTQTPTPTSTPTPTP